jgi:Glycoside Hydrolase Family 113
MKNCILLDIRIEMKLRFNLVFFMMSAALMSCAQDLGSPKINGLSLVSEQFLYDSTHVRPIVDIGANYAAVIPFCFMPKKDSSAVKFGNNDFWKGEGPQGTRIAIQELHKKKIKTMIKPQVWVGHGVYTGEIEMKSEESWILFEKNYGDYILAFAKIAEEENVDLFCIGTEMKLVVEKRPELLPKLLKKVRSVYSGRITYAENWDCFDKVKFWDQLDYVGVDAYFPISTSKKPSLKKLKKGWLKYLHLFDSLSASLDKKILFTEYGYRSIKECAKTPWSYEGKDHSISEKSQARALKALYESVWDKKYFAGGFLWKWHPDNENAGGEDNSMFTVQNKQAESVVRKRFLSE